MWKKNLENRGLNIVYQRGKRRGKREGQEKKELGAFCILKGKGKKKEP